MTREEHITQRLERYADDIDPLIKAGICLDTLQSAYKDITLEHLLIYRRIKRIEHPRHL